MKTITIATAHSENYQRGKDKKIEVELQGGSPYFQYLWIDDKLHTLYKTQRGVKLEKTKARSFN